jgi:acetyltransferase-like isoleucine patch superfamily enzyme
VNNIGKKLHWTTGTARAEDGGVTNIGKDCLFSEQIMIRVSDRHAIFDAQNMESINPTRNVYIENYVWLCYWASVGKGCRVGTGTVVGKNAMAFGN